MLNNKIGYSHACTTITEQSCLTLVKSPLALSLGIVQETVGVRGKCWWSFLSSSLSSRRRWSSIKSTDSLFPATWYMTSSNLTWVTELMQSLLLPGVTPRSSPHWNVRVNHAYRLSNGCTPQALALLIRVTRRLKYHFHWAPSVEMVIPRLPRRSGERGLHLFVQCCNREMLYPSKKKSPQWH